MTLRQEFHQAFGMLAAGAFYSALGAVFTIVAIARTARIGVGWAIDRVGAQ